MTDPLTTTDQDGHPSDVARNQGAPLGAWAWLLAWAVVGVGSAIGAAGLRLDGAADAQLWMHAYNLGHALGLGLLTTAWALLARRWCPDAPLLATAVLALGVGVLVLPETVMGPAGRLTAHTGVAGWSLLIVAAIVASVPITQLLARLLAHGFASRMIVIAIAGALAIVNHFVMPLRHPGLHLFIAWCAAAAIAGAMASHRCWVPPRGARGLLALTIGAATLAFVVPVPPRAADLLARASGCVVFPLRARWSAARESRWLPERAIAGEWFAARDQIVPIPPTSELVRPSAPIVLLLSVDALRADALSEPGDEPFTRSMRRLRDSSVWFTQARAPSTRTVATLASVFSGRYFSQLRWGERDHPVAGRLLWPIDSSPGLAHVLDGAGVLTINVASVDYLVNDYGVVAGFARDRLVQPSLGVGPSREPRWASAHDVADAIIEELAGLAQTSRPALVFAHFLDAHAPHDLGDAASHDDERDRWRIEVGLVDAQIGRVLEALDATGLDSRTIVILTADHGEAFGEHGTHEHGTTLYDELLRVPLLIRAPAVTGCGVDVPVTLMDIGPTIVDLFGHPTPASWFGESLVPTLLGHPHSFERPLAFEARPKQAWIGADGMKVIRDLRLGTLEAYDLVRDPAETLNLYDGSSIAREALFGELAVFFSVHEHRAPGYETPVR